MATSTLHVVLAGGSGFLGTHLRKELERRGHRVTTLLRRPAANPRESTWDPATGVIDVGVVQAADVVVNLAGSPTLGNPHSSKWARELRESRVSTTDLIASTIAATDRPPAFLAGNGISWYGDHGSTVLTEASDTLGHALLTEVTREWQAAAAPAVDAGARVCILRTSPVMDHRSPPLKMLVPLFKAGLGGRLGSGKQHMAMISLRDWVGAVGFLAEHPDASGPVNLCCPQTPTNAEFTTALAKALNRPAFAWAPSPLIKLGAGSMSSELLGSLNVRPAALEGWGYDFADADVEAVLDSGLS